MPLADIERAFAHRPALMPYFPLGYPDPDTSLAVVESIARAGADLIELGLSFSDPLADGPVIQRATQIALQNGMTSARSLQMTAALRRCGVSTPFLLMGYLNPLLAYGLPRFVADAAQAGADGLIVPDLPIEEADELDALCAEHDLALIYMLAPTSTPERIERVARRARGFIYLVSLTGITGARGNLPDGLADFVERVRRMTDCPLAVGFGISTPEQAAAVGRIAEGVIVGSALVATARNGNAPEAAGAFVGSLRVGLPT
ncbi:MAG TPA: tryptophan synthase subunit alpha [Anaerolineae bacterium]|nr:tryptophan synthase subunit alpha [Anaerolineae bacterium]